MGADAVSVRYASAPELEEMFRMKIAYRALAVALATLPVSALVSAQALPKTPATPATPATPGANPTPGPATAPRPSRFDEIDTNHDGVITKDEFLKAEKDRFDEFDTNHDGKIDAKEIASSPPLMERNVKTAERMVKQWDANGDGVVTADEYRKNAEDRFAKQDKDGTGKITKRAPPTQAMPMLTKPGQSPTPLQPVPPAAADKSANDPDKH
jgi:Ca2+-binding EF-hand superfamily protein